MTSSSGERDTTSSRHHSGESIIHGQDIPMSEYSDGGTGREYDDRESNEQTNKSNDRLRSNDAMETGPGPASPFSDKERQIDIGDDKSFPSAEESQSIPSSPQVSNGVNPHDHDQQLRRRRTNRSRDHVVIEIDDEKEHFQSPSGHMESYLHIMQFIGISAFRRVEYRRLDPTVAILLKALFWIVSAAAFLNSLKTLKRVAIERAPSDKDLKYCLTIGFAAIRCFSRFYFIKIAGTQSEKLSVMLLHIRNTRLFTNGGKFSFSMLATIMATATFIFTTVKVIFGYLVVDKWNWNDALQYRTYALSTTLFAWSSEYNVTEALADEYLYPTPTSLHVMMGLFEGFLDFCETLQGEVIRDLLILACLTIHTDQTAFEERIQPQLLIHPNNIDPAEVEGSLRQFKCVNEESSSINSTLVTPFKFVTIQNLLLYAYLFVQLIGYKGMTLRLIHSIVDALKGLVLFYIGMRLHWKNSSIKKWLHFMSSYTGPVNIQAILGMSVQSTIYDFRDDPIGLGSDYFLINESFMVGLIAAVGSLISLLFEFDRYQATVRRLLL